MEVRAGSRFHAATDSGDGVEERNVIIVHPDRERLHVSFAALDGFAEVARARTDGVHFKENVVALEVGLLAHLEQRGVEAVISSQSVDTSGSFARRAGLSFTYMSPSCCVCSGILRAHGASKTIL